MLKVEGLGAMKMPTLRIGTVGFYRMPNGAALEIIRIHSENF